MCLERNKNQRPISKQLVQFWYMKHVFKDLRGSWHCISFARRKKKKSYLSQAEMAKSMSLKRASARAAAETGSLRSNSDKSGWMFNTCSALYSNSRRKSKGRDHAFSKLKDLIRASSFDGRDLASTSSLTELIASADLDLGNVAISTDSDLLTTGAPPSRRSSDSFPSTYASETNASAEGCLSRPGLPRSAFRAVRHCRRKRSIFRASKTSVTSSARGRRQSAAANSTGSSTKHGYWATQKAHKAQAPHTPENPNLSRGTSLTMDTSSSTCKSSSTGWLENYDVLTESLSVSSWSGQTDCLHETKHSEEIKRRRATGVEENGSQNQKRPSIPLAPVSTEDLRKRQASAIDGVRHTGKDLQQAIVDIIQENDVQDLVDLEEFLQGYFRLNTLYQDIIQQFFNELSDEFVNPQVSTAPSIMARLASTSTTKATGRARLQM